jgi:PKD domain
VTDPDDASPATTWTITPSAGVDPGTTCAFANASNVDTSVTCTDDGVFTATLTADDSFAPPVSDTTTVTVANVPPDVTIASPTSGTLFQVGDLVTVDAPFTDPGTNDSHTCMIDWGDGVTDTGTIAAGACTGGHTYTSGGTVTITVTVTDDDGDSDSDSVSIDINAPPDCSTVTPDKDRLWPPNHSLRLVTIGGATDPDGDTVTLSIDGISQDEPVDAVGSGQTQPDAFLVPGKSDQASLRAERAGPRDGRVYQIAFTGDDGRGGTCTGVAAVQVPKSNNGAPAIDSSPPIFNSLLP